MGRFFSFFGEELLVHSGLNFCARETEPRHPGGAGNVPDEGGGRGPQSLLRRNLLRELFLPPLLFAPLQGGVL